MTLYLIYNALVKLSVFEEHSAEIIALVELRP
jgi:hypothetical protein